MVKYTERYANCSFGNIFIVHSDMLSDYNYGTIEINQSTFSNESDELPVRPSSLLSVCISKEEERKSEAEFLAK